MKRALLTIATATAVMGFTGAAMAVGPSSPVVGTSLPTVPDMPTGGSGGGSGGGGPVEHSPAEAPGCEADPWSCICSSGSAFYSLTHWENTFELLSVLEWVSIEDVYLVNIEEALNGDIIDILNFYQSRVLNDVNVGLLQDLLTNVVVVTAGDDVIEIDEFLNGNDIDIGDVVSLDILSGNQIIIFYQ
ncbi:hypothetical protein [Chondromyces apiculatus]|nr:hypothetical protein [Chondromyces apiculatus]